ncbi:hypothetical protein CPC735_025630 [Coccidioides posadasii C735 delta SOWgp]|uniref:Uncharacterized protein n=1 Tax=Coccidioides posadasii (strain C735) TaxID=222929 RepID=C5P727_COCP7|nr:hypothetical protein CPC735_025630 [Coccidioides posadasii C735 delta SOWgp]EER27227.1 hypothetical protein CPC735_025630 [Coccidioides posadasii C735 delta SOWgp]|eukprot:XP_003069372.1 hypothetical protein CPC735_025630 [Coccidioides posadasii C735 delta SOWgp]
MSDNFDYPPASNDHPPRPQLSQATHARLNLASQLRHLRELIEFHDGDGTQRDRALDTLNREVEESYPATAASRLSDYRLNNRSSGDHAERRDRLRRAMQDASDAVETHLISTGSRRPRAGWEDDLSMMVGARRLADINGLSGIQSAQERLRAASSTIRTLLDDSNATPGPASREHPSERQSSRRRNKRIKLDSDDKREGIRGLSYGHYGQVVPGALEMEILSCDGGAYGLNGRTSWPQNILEDDNSVFSAKNERCNIILKHHGQTPFCLRRLVIKAPNSGYDGPAGIREGMVFVTMASDELLSRTARYHIIYSCRPLRPPPRRHSWQTTSQRYLSALRASLQSPQRTVLVHPEQLSSHADNSTDPEDRSQPQTTSRQLSPDRRTEFHVTLEQDDRSDDGSIPDQHSEELTANAEGAYEDMSEYLYPVECSTDSSDDEVSDTSDRLLDEIRRQVRQSMGVDSSSIGLRSRLLPNIIAPPAGPYSGNAEATEPVPPAEEVLSPHARFFIRRDKSSVSIKFDPPVSGRFVLVKMWSPFGNGTVDIQNITAYGYAGPRFFPSLQFR